MDVFFFRDYKRRDFVYTESGQQQTVSIIAPRGYVKEEVRDTAGIRLHTFRYPDGSLLYAAFLADTTYELQAINKATHQPKSVGAGSLVYKGQDEDERYYREVRQGRLRFGYSGVPSVNEVYFDSATNYAAMMRR